MALGYLVDDPRRRRDRLLRAAHAGLAGAPRRGLGGGVALEAAEGRTARLTAAEHGLEGGAPLVAPPEPRRHRELAGVEPRRHLLPAQRRRHGRALLRPHR